ncbi:MAG: insulinase family protein [Planctomycetota bacterium]|nr:MAG: insulinase family protein [Planctomycetota bacterium]
MRKLLLAVIGVALFCVASHSEDEVLKIDVKEKILDNGLTVLVVERPGTPEIACRVFFKVGSANEVPGITGVSHLVEHMMFKGTGIIGTKDPVKDAEYNRRINEIVLEMRGLEADADKNAAKLKELQKELDELRVAQKEITVSEEIWEHYQRKGGTRLNAMTGTDYTGYVVSVPSNKLELFFWLESDRMANSVFREFYAELGVIKEERRLHENRPTGFFHETFEAVMYDAHPYSHPIVGWMVDLENMTLEKALKYQKTYYVPNNAVVVLVGDVKSEEAFELAEKYFGRIPRGEDPPPVVTMEHPQRYEKRVYGEIDTQPQVMISYHAPSIKHPDIYPLQVLDRVLSGNAGPLYKKIVRDRELATSCSCSAGRDKFPSSFSFYGTAKGEVSPEEVEEAIYEIIDEIKSKPVPKKDLERAKKQIRAQVIRMLASNGFLAYMLAGGECMHGWRNLLESPAKIAKVTEEDIMRVAKKYFVKTNRTVGIITQPEKVLETYLTIRLMEVPRTPEMETQMGRMEKFISTQQAGVSVRMDDENIYIEVGRFGLDEREVAEERLKLIEDKMDEMGGMLPFRPRIVTVGDSEEGSGEEDDDR